MRIFIKAIRFFRREIFIPMNNFLIIAAFFMRKFFLGPQNAILYFTRIDKSAVIQLLKLNGASIGDNCDIETGLTFHNCTDFNNLSIGNNCHIGKNCFFDLRDRITIEDNCIISMRSMFITHMDINKSDLRMNYPAKHEKIIIRNNSYIGANAIILLGVKVDEKSIVAANALVRENVGTYTMVGGVPAKLIKSINHN